jgi:hypothetical protein
MPLYRFEISSPLDLTSAIERLAGAMLSVRVTARLHLATIAIVVAFYACGLAATVVPGGALDGVSV